MKTFYLKPKSSLCMEIIDVQTNQCLGEAMRVDILSSAEKNATKALQKLLSNSEETKRQEGFGFPYVITSPGKEGNTDPASYLNLALDSKYGDLYAYTFMHDPTLSKNTVHLIMTVVNDDLKNMKTSVSNSFLEADSQFYKEIMNAEKNGISWVSWQMFAIQPISSDQTVPSVFQLIVRNWDKDGICDYAFNKLAPLACQPKALT
jgi:hypothetical protein